MILGGTHDCAWCGEPATQRVTVADFNKVTVTMWCEAHLPRVLSGLRTRKAHNNGAGPAWRVTAL